MALSRLLPAQNRKNEMVRQLVRLLSVNEYPDYKLNEKGCKFRHAGTPELHDDKLCQLSL